MKYFLGIFVFVLLVGICVYDFDDLFLYDEVNEKLVGDCVDDFEVDFLWNDEVIVEGFLKRYLFVVSNLLVFEGILNFCLVRVRVSNLKVFFSFIYEGSIV